MSNCLIVNSSSDCTGALAAEQPWVQDVASTLKTSYKVHQVTWRYAGDLDSVIRDAETAVGPISVAVFMVHGKENGVLVCEDGPFTKEMVSSVYLSGIQRIWFCSCYAGVPNGIGSEFAKRGVTVYAASDFVSIPVFVSFQGQLAIIDAVKPDTYKRIEQGMETPVDLAEDDLEKQLLLRGVPLFLHCFYERRSLRGNREQEQAERDRQLALEYLMAQAQKNDTDSQARLLGNVRYSTRLEPSYIQELIVVLTQKALVHDRALDALGKYYFRNGQKDFFIEFCAQLYRDGNRLGSAQLLQLSHHDDEALMVLLDVAFDKQDQAVLKEYTQRLLEKAEGYKSANPPDLENAAKLYRYGLKLNSSECFIALAEIEVGNGNYQEAFKLVDGAVGKFLLSEYRVLILLDRIRLITPPESDLIPRIDVLKIALTNGAPNQEHAFTALGGFHDSCHLDDSDVGFRWYVKAAKRGSMLARAIVGVTYQSMLTKALPHQKMQYLQESLMSFHQAAEQGDVLSEYRFTQLVFDPSCCAAGNKRERAEAAQREREQLFKFLKPEPMIRTPKTQDELDAVPVETLRRKAKRKIELLSL